MTKIDYDKMIAYAEQDYNKANDDLKHFIYYETTAMPGIKKVALRRELMNRKNEAKRYLEKLRREHE